MTDHSLERGTAILDAHIADNHGTTVTLQRGDTITPEPISWLWPGWLAARKLHILAGAPGTGKTTIALAFAATVTQGGMWPDGTQAAHGNVFIWSGEDDPQDTIVPRLVAMGADLKRIFIISGVTDRGERRTFDPATDSKELHAAIKGGAALLIIDPITSAITGDSHKNSEVRRGLQPLADLAAATGCALLGISHFSKGTAGRDPTERVTGSLAFGAFARIVMATAKRNTEEGGDRVLCRSKSNIGGDSGGFAYDLQQAALDHRPGVTASRILWGDAIEGTAREILATAETESTGEGGSGAKGNAIRFLLDLLGDGAVRVTTIKDSAKAAGHSWRTVERAKEDLGIKSTRMTFGGESYWALSHIDRQENPYAANKKNGGLCGNVAEYVESGNEENRPTVAVNGSEFVEGTI